MDQSIDHFHEHGWMRVESALPAASAAAMRDAVWAALASVGIHRDRPSTWTVERPSHLQALKNHAAFRWHADDSLQQAIKAILGPSCHPPDHWGAVFIAFPGSEPWGVPTRGWHIDANYRSQLNPSRGVKTLALFGEVEPRGGGTQVVAGSHRLVANWFATNPPPADARSAALRRLLLSQPYIGDLHRAGDPAERIARFIGRAEDAEGIRLQVVELAGAAGDVFLMHPLLMHAAAPNNSGRPRFMLSGGVTTDMWGWASG